MKKLTINVPVEINSESLKAAFSRRGIKQNQANVRRFLALIQKGIKIDIGDVYDEALADKSLLLMHGFTFEDDSREEDAE